MGNKSSLMLQDEEIRHISQETGFTPLQIEKLFSRFAQLDRGNLGSLTRNDLMSIPELAINPLCDRLIQMFFAGCDPDDERINFKQFMRILATFRAGRHNNNIDQFNNTNIVKRLSSHSGVTSVRHNHNRHTSLRNVARADSSGDRYPMNSHNGRHNWSLYQNGSPNVLSSKLEFIFRIYDVDDDSRISFEDLKAILKMMVGNYIEDVQLDKIATRAFTEADQDNDGFIDFHEFCKVFSAKDLDDKLRVKFF